jgi:sugar phosphate isomerase/epimerase
VIEGGIMFGLIFEEKKLTQMTLDAYIDYIRGLVIFNALEIGFTEDLVSNSVLDAIQCMDYSLSFHMPYHLERLHTDALSLSLDQELSRKDILSFLTFAYAIKTTRSPIMVIHLSDDKNHNQNMRYLNHLLEVNAKKQLGFRYAIENTLNPNTYYNTQEILSYLSFFNTENLGLCLDLPNMLIGKESTSATNPIHIHFHGFNSSENHLGLDSSIEWKQLLSHYPNVIQTLELLDRPDYFKALKHSSSLLK